MIHTRQRISHMTDGALIVDWVVGRKMGCLGREKGVPVFGVRLRRAVLRDFMQDVRHVGKVCDRVCTVGWLACCLRHNALATGRDTREKSVFAGAIGCTVLASDDRRSSQSDVKC